MFDLSRLTFLQAVDRHGSVGSAARELGYTSSAVSQQVGKLEREVGAQLLEPAGRGVVLTDAAMVLVDACDAIDAARENARARLEALREGFSGTLRLACFPSGIRGVAAPALAALNQASPELQLHLKELAPEPALEALRGGSVDVALVHDWEHDRTSFPASLEGVHLANDPVDLLVPMTHPLARHASAKLSETVDDVWVTDVSDGICTRWILDMLNAATDNPRVQFRAEEYASQVELVASGLCIAVLPRLGRPVLPETVQVVPLSGAVPTRRLYVVTRRSSTRRPAVTLLHRALRLQVAEETRGVERRMPGVPDRRRTAPVR